MLTVLRQFHTLWDIKQFYVWCVHAAAVGRGPGLFKKYSKSNKEPLSSQHVMCVCQGVWYVRQRGEIILTAAPGPDYSLNAPVL